MDQGILDSVRQKTLISIEEVVFEMVLGGGTALAQQIKHRKSFDFDFFSPLEITKKLLTNLSGKIKINSIAVDSPDELTLFTSGDVKLTFLFYPFPKIFEFIHQEGQLKLFDIQALAAQKAYTVGRRGEYRDYFDMYSILKIGKCSLGQTISLAGSIYNGSFSEKLFLEQLTFFDDLLDFNLISLEESKKLANKQEVKTFLESQVFQYLKKKD